MEFEICSVTGEEVPACSCGPHLECPEHLLNCVLGSDEADEAEAEADIWVLRQLEQPFTRADAERKMSWSEDKAKRRLVDLVTAGDVVAESPSGCGDALHSRTGSTSGV